MDERLTSFVAIIPLLISLAPIVNSFTWHSSHLSSVFLLLCFRFNRFRKCSFYSFRSIGHKSGSCFRSSSLHSTLQGPESLHTSVTLISYYILSHKVISYHIMLDNILSNSVMSYSILSYYIVSYHTILYHIEWYYIILCYYYPFFLIIHLSARLSIPLLSLPLSAPLS